MAECHAEPPPPFPDDHRNHARADPATPEPLRHLSWTHPFAHRPLVEFMLTIPPGQVCRPGEPRRLMRRAFAALLPEPVANRKSKAVYTQPFRQALVSMAAVLWPTPKIRTVDLGSSERDNLLERLRRFSQGLDCNENQLRQILLFEFWIRSRENRTASPSAVRPCRARLPRPWSPALENWRSRTSRRSDWPVPASRPSPSGRAWPWPFRDRTPRHRPPP